MADAIFIDAGAWIAIFWPLDTNHQNARDIWHGLINGEWPLVTTNWTLYEALTFLVVSAKRHDIALEALQEARAAVEILSGEEVENDALNTFKQYDDKQWSVVDCVNFHTIQKRGCQQAFAYDRHFQQASGIFGFQVIPYPSTLV